MTVKALFGSGIDSTPDQFTFTDVSGINPSTVTTSGTVTVTGLSPNIPINVTASGGTVDVGTSSLSGTYDTSKSVTTSSTGTFVMAARATSSASYSASVNVTVTVNGVSDTFTVTTRAADTTPNAFSFNDTSNAALSTNYSTSVYPTGYDYASWSVSGGYGSVDNSTWATSGTIYAGQTFYVRGTSSSSYSSNVNVDVNIGGQTDTYTITTRAVDTTPDAFSFTSVYNASTSTSYTSNTVTIYGLDPNISVNVSGYAGAYIDAGTYGLSGSFSTSKSVTTSGSGTLVVAVQGTSSGSYSVTSTYGAIVGGVTGYFSITTLSPDYTPDQFYFTSISNATALNDVYASSPVTVYGFSPNVYVTVTASNGYINGGTWNWWENNSYNTSLTLLTSSSGTISIAALVRSSSSYSTSTSCTVSISGVSATFTVTTATPPTGEAVFTYSSTWTAPANVTSVCVVAIGAGNQYAGGALRYINNVSVTPGSSYSISVGSGYSWTTALGLQVSSGSQGYGGSGGNGGSSGSTGNGGGGGAGGYTGNGGNGGEGSTTAYTWYGTDGSGGSGGAGGGGAGGGYQYGEYQEGYFGFYGTGGWPGGGVGLYGQGVSGSGSYAAGGVYQGQPGSGGSAQNYGGGGCGPAVYNGSYNGGGPAAVRIIWGPGRSFPYNAS